MKFNEFPFSKQFICLKKCQFVYLAPTKSKIANLAIWRPPGRQIGGFGGVKFFECILRNFRGFLHQCCIQCCSVATTTLVSQCCSVATLEGLHTTYFHYTIFLLLSSRIFLLCYFWHFVQCFHKFFAHSRNRNRKLSLQPCRFHDHDAQQNQ